MKKCTLNANEWGREWGENCVFKSLFLTCIVRFLGGLVRSVNDGPYKGTEDGLRLADCARPQSPSQVGVKFPPIKWEMRRVGFALSPRARVIPDRSIGTSSYACFLTFRQRSNSKRWDSKWRENFDESNWIQIWLCLLKQRTVVHKAISNINSINNTPKELGLSVRGDYLIKMPNWPAQILSIDAG